MLLGIEVLQQKKQTGSQDSRWACKTLLGGHSGFQVTSKGSTNSVTGGLGGQSACPHGESLFWVCLNTTYRDLQGCPLPLW